MPQLVVTKGPARGRILKLSKNDSPIIGRKDSPIVIDDPHISRQHVRFFMKEDRWYVEDMGSSNGTFLNGGRVTEATKLHSGDKIMIGQTQLVVRASKGKGPKRPPLPGSSSVGSGLAIPGGVHVESDRKSLDASSLMMDILDDLETDSEEIDAFVPDFDPNDPSVWEKRRKEREQSSTAKTAVPGEPGPVKKDEKGSRGRQK